MEVTVTMDPLFLAWSSCRRRKFQRCSDICSKLLSESPYDQAAWSLKTRALTEMVYIDEVEVDQEGIADMMLDESSIAQVARPGTSLRLPGTSQGGAPTPAVRPMTQSGRPITGFVRPSTLSGRPETMEQAIRTPRTASTARPVTSASGRFVRLGTALDLAALATEHVQFKDWWWKVQLGKCYYRLGLHREAEKQFRSALAHQEFVDTYLYLAKVYQRLDQPITALNVFKQGLDHFPAEVTLLTGIARVHEEMNNITSATEYYKEVLKQDNTHVEAIACIGSNHFYTDQPEIALRFYRRLLQMGVFNCQLYNNLGLCCFYAQQYDMTLSSFERALALVSSDEEQADVWYNLGHVAVGIGDLTLAYQCFKLALAFNNNHGEAYNNLAVLELRKGRIEQAKAFLQTAASLSPHMYEPHFNFATLSDKVGDLQSSYMAAQKSEDAFPEHVDTQQILKNLRQHFATL
ncbi:tetratricopeptide repeat protein 8 isoform X3 [Onychostoma macrolepis]|uniref:tetratricopeptide repeat protein 8 isoform X3 n=1 Tax=Onychostoma macrolepis TaxID=369639 RepID=UPI00272ADF17|nr:tetratricopeptide repeat protein 8 isoform X3 [Onychostoma macrolepis]